MQLLKGNPVLCQVYSDLCDAWSFLIQVNSHTKLSESSRVLFLRTPQCPPTSTQWNNNQLSFLSMSARHVPNQLHAISLIATGSHTDRGLPFKMDSGSLPTWREISSTAFTFAENDCRYVFRAGDTAHTIGAPHFLQCVWCCTVAA